MKKVIIAGCGYLGSATGLLFQRQGWDVTGWRLHANEERLPFPVEQVDIGEAEDVGKRGEQLAAAKMLVQCASSNRGGAESYRRVFLEGAKNLLRYHQGQRFIFVSSTSVYAQTDGSLVDETAPAEPDRETGKILRQAEELVLERGGIVVRSAGIYGPGRNIVLEKFLAGKAVIEGADGGRYINQVHRDDLAAAIVLLADAPDAAGIYNAAEDDPLRQADLYQRLAQRLGGATPPVVAPDPNRKRGWTNKRVSNERLRKLGWQPRNFLSEVRAERSD